MLDVARIICLRVSERLCAQRGDGFWDGEDGRSEIGEDGGSEIGEDVSVCMIRQHVRLEVIEDCKVRGH